MGWNWILHDLRRSMLSVGEKAGIPFLALQKIANHVIKREVTDQYLIIDTEFIRPHMELISGRLLDLMGTSVQEWKQLDSGINVKSSSEGALGDSARVEQHEASILNVAVFEEEANEVYW